jgi:hypothetical protein
MGMNEDDELLVAWLVKRGYKLMAFGAGIEERILITMSSIAYPAPVTVEHLGMWVDGGTGTSPWKVWLYHTQRGKRRPLRSAVREWMFGI